MAQKKAAAKKPAKAVKKAVKKPIKKAVKKTIKPAPKKKGVKPAVKKKSTKPAPKKVVHAQKAVKKSTKPAPKKKSVAPKKTAKPAPKKVVKPVSKKAIAKQENRAAAQKNAVDELLARGKQRGFVTEDEIIHILPDVEQDLEGLEALYEKLETGGIRIVGSEEMLKIETVKEGEKYGHDKSAKEAAKAKERLIDMGEDEVSADLVQMYLKEIGRVPLLNGEEEVKLAKAIEKVGGADLVLTGASAEEVANGRALRGEACDSAARQAGYSTSGAFSTMPGNALRIISSPAGVTCVNCSRSFLSFLSFSLLYIELTQFSFNSLNSFSMPFF